MKIRLLGALVGLAIGFTVPAFAQEQNTVDPEVRQQIEAALRKYDETYNTNDAAAIATLYTPDAVEVFRESSGGGTVSGQQAIEKKYAVEASTSNMAHKLVEVYAIGNDICAITEYKVQMWKGHYTVIYVRDADTWKIRMACSN
jgi:Nuclear transport factor 2 (NTF2) domain.